MWIQGTQDDRNATVGIGPFLVFFLVLGLAKVGRNGDIAHGVRPHALGLVHIEGWSRRRFIILGVYTTWRQASQSY